MNQLFASSRKTIARFVEGYETVPRTRDAGLFHDRCGKATAQRRMPGSFPCL